MNCVYCGEPITVESREHIIQNAIGGLEESTDICCSICNNYISKYIDKPFVTTFNPIIARINNFAKTNNKKSSPSYSGKAIYNGNEYSVLFKNGQVVACPELSKQLHCDISKLDFEIVSYDFIIDNETFIKGVSKIAFNYALSKGIQFDTIKDGLIVEKDENSITNISFKYQVIPFVPLNPMDSYIELETKLLLYHNLILFSQENNLWCYVDLFNTFQYYICLTDKWPKDQKVSESYFQQLQKLDRTIPKIERWRPKYGLIYADLYEVAPSPDKIVMQKRITSAIQKESLKKDMAKVLSQKLGTDYMLNYIRDDISEDERRKYGLSLLLYFDENDDLIEDRFRKVTLGEKEFDMVSYPLLINNLMMANCIDARQYTFAKFERLNYFLCNEGKQGE